MIEKRQHLQPISTLAGSPRGTGGLEASLMPHSKSAGAFSGPSPFFSGGNALLRDEPLSANNAYGGGGMMEQEEGTASVLSFRSGGPGKAAAAGVESSSLPSLPGAPPGGSSTRGRPANIQVPKLQLSALSPSPPSTVSPGAGTAFSSPNLPDLPRRGSMDSVRGLPCMVGCPCSLLFQGAGMPADMLHAWQAVVFAAQLVTPWL